MIMSEFNKSPALIVSFTSSPSYFETFKILKTNFAMKLKDAQGYADERNASQL